jgi:hypothetical protein
MAANGSWQIWHSEGSVVGRLLAAAAAAAAALLALALASTACAALVFVALKELFIEAVAVVGDIWLRVEERRKERRGKGVKGRCVLFPTPNVELWRHADVTCNRR